MGLVKDLSFRAKPVDVRRVSDSRGACSNSSRLCRRLRHGLSRVVLVIDESGGEDARTIAITLSWQSPAAHQAAQPHGTPSLLFPVLTGGLSRYEQGR